MSVSIVFLLDRISTWPYCRVPSSEFKGYLHNLERPRNDGGIFHLSSECPFYHELLVLLRHGTYVQLAHDLCYIYFTLAY